MNTIWIKERDYDREEFGDVMAESGSSWKNFSGDNDSERFTIQPYQFEPRIDSDEADNIPEGGISGDESDIETTNPRLQSSDWYFSLMIVKASICCHK